MQFNSIGDLSHSFQMRNHNTRIKNEFIRLSETLASGRHSDMSKELNGEFSNLASVERAIQSLLAHRTTGSETTTLLETAQISLETVQSLGSNLGPSLITAGNSSQPAILRSTAADSEQKFDSVIAALNVRIADRSVFAGMATDQPALLNSNEILTEVRTAVLGLSTITEVIDMVDSWFSDPGGGYETFAYQGSKTALAPIPISDTEEVHFDITAESAEIRSMLKAYALAAISVDLPLLSTNELQAELMKEAGELMLTSQSDIAILRADIGAKEAYTAGASARNEMSLTSFRMMQTDFYSADPYETATRLEVAQTQLEAVYTLTARISRLSLADYL